MLRKEKRAASEAMRTFGRKWLGIWMHGDEAIVGLKRTLGARGPITPKMDSFAKQFGRDKVIAVLYGPITLLFRPIYNRWVASIIDGFIWAGLKNKMQGTDLSGIRLESVCEAPPPIRTCPPLPRSITEEILKSANEHAKLAVPAIRDSLGVSALADNDLGILLTSMAERLSGRELVHTSYFDNQGVLDVICFHILRSFPVSSPSGRYAAELTQWHAEFLEHVQEAIARLET